MRTLLIPNWWWVKDLSNVMSSSRGSSQKLFLYPIFHYFPVSQIMHKAQHHSLKLTAVPTFIHLFSGSSTTRIHQEQIPGVDHQPPPAFNRPVNSTCTKSAKDFYICLSNQLGDPTLDAMILDNLEVTCEPRYSSTLAQKRNSKYVSKQKFYSWGGKRNNANVFYPWGGKRNTARVHQQPKVVIRNPFHAWGGKRNQQDEIEF